ncbi:cytochrome P450 [Bisporella sp. PMI_857]|nr:cytochrome P450 [Bisporella sp. PMI_857]
MAPLNPRSTLENSLLGVCGVFFLSLCYFLGLAIYRVYFHPLAAYPGPKICAITRLPYLWNLVKGRQTHNARELHKMYGDVVRIAPNELSYTNSKAWKDIYRHRQGKPEMAKNRKSYTTHPGGEHIIIANREDHSRFRKNLSHGFSDSSLRQQEPLIQSYVDLLVRRLEEHSQDRQIPQNMCSWYNWITFDIIGDLTFGEPFGCLDNSDYHPWVSTIFDNIKAGIYISALSSVPYGRKAVSWLVSKELLAKKTAHHQLTVEKVKHRVELTDERPDFLGNILKQKERGFTFPELVSNSSILIIAGSETTATILSGVTYLLLTTPNVMAKVVNEVRSSFSNNNEITIHSTSSLKYMIACLEEALRVYPPAPAGFPRVVPEEGDFIAGRWVPCGTVVGVNIIAAHRSPNNFHDPDSFIPERFLGDPRFVNDDRNALNPFSTGPRNCLGKNLAWSEMRLILAKVLFNFDLELARGSENWLDQKSYTIWEKGPLNVRLKKFVR